MNEFDDCIIGVCYRIGQEPIIAYDKDLVIGKMMEEDGVSEQDAIDWYEYNQLGAWMGELTPCFIERKTLEEINDSCL